jgi:hypothetical protein
MKLTKDYLKRIIKEEMRKTLREQEEVSLPSQEMAYVVGIQTDAYGAEGSVDIRGVFTDESAAENFAKTSRSYEVFKFILNKGYDNSEL